MSESEVALTVTRESPIWWRKHKLLSVVTNVMSLYMLNRVSEWGMAFANTSTHNGMEIAAIIAAVGVPAVSFAGWVYQTHKVNS